MKKYVLVIAIALALVGAVVALLNPRMAGAPAPSQQAADAPLAISPGPVSAPDPNIGVSVANSGRNDVDIAIRQGKRVSGPEIVRAHKGEIVTFHITSDASDDFMLRGYETRVQLVKGAAATLILKANREGQFVYELHKSGLQLGVLEVAAP